MREVQSPFARQRFSFLNDVLINQKTTHEKQLIFAVEMFFLSHALTHAVVTNDSLVFQENCNAEPMTRDVNWCEQLFTSECVHIWIQTFFCNFV